METKKSQQRLTEEFRVEAVKQVTKKGFTMAEERDIRQSAAAYFAKQSG